MNDLEQKEYDELSAIVKATGFMSLDTQEKRKRYSYLNSKIKEGNEKVALTKFEIQEMIDQGIERYKKEAIKASKNTEEGLDEAIKIGKWIKSKVPKKENSVASLRVYREDGESEGGVIVDWKFIKNIFNEETRKHDLPLYRIWVRYDKDNIKDYEITLPVWTQIPEMEKVEILKSEVDEQEMVVGVGQKAYTKGGYSFSDPSMFGTKLQQSGDSFQYKVVRTQTTCTVKRPNGDVFELDSSKLNQ